MSDLIQCVFGKIICQRYAYLSSLSQENYCQGHLHSVAKKIKNGDHDKVIEVLPIFYMLSYYHTIVAAILAFIFTTSYSYS